MIKVILFDFGGVVAEEGFREGLMEIARKNGLEPKGFYTAADDLIHETGYLTGQARESDYWSAVRERTRIKGADQEFRQEILKRFVLRPDMVGCVDRLRAKGFGVVMLSDQTNWLDEIDRKERIFDHFNRVLNSFRTHLTKWNASTFEVVSAQLGVKSEEVLLIDDNEHHVLRAASRGLKTIRFTTFDDFEKKLQAVAGTSCTK